MPQTTGGAGGEGAEDQSPGSTARKRRRHYDGSDDTLWNQPDDVVDPTGVSRANQPRTGLYDRLAALEETSRSTMVTGLSYAAALTSTHDVQAAIYGSTMARQMQLPSSNMKDKMDRLIDPATGEPVSLKRTRLIGRAGMSAGIAKILVDLETKGAPITMRIQDPDNPSRYVSSRKKLTPGDIMPYIDAMSVLPGKLDATVALGTAVQMAVSGHMRVDIFRQNLINIHNWNGGRKTAVQTEAEQIAIAQWWTEHEHSVITGIDLVAMTDPDVLEASAALDQSQHTRAVGLIGEANLANIAAAKEHLDQAWQLHGGAGALVTAGSIAQPIIDQMNRESNWFEKSVGWAFEELDRGWHALVGSVWGIGNYAGKGIAHLVGDTTTEMGFEANIKDAWDIFNYRTRPGDVFAKNVGFTPGTTAFAVVSGMSEFVAGIYIDPLTIFGNVRRGIGLRRLVMTGDEDFLKGTGIFKSIFEAHYAQPWNSPLARMDAALDATVNNSWLRRITGSGRFFGKSDQTFAEWMTREALNGDIGVTHMVDNPRGLFGLGAGIDRRVAAWISSYAQNEGGGVFTKELVEDVKDLFRVSAGVLPETEIGTKFRFAMDADELSLNVKVVRGGLRKALEETNLVNFTSKGELAAASRSKIEAMVVKHLTDRGISRQQAKAIAKNVSKLKASDIGLRVPKRVAGKPAKGLRNIHLAGKTGKARSEVIQTLVPHSQVEKAALQKSLTFDDLMRGFAMEGPQRVIPTIGHAQALRDLRLGIKDSDFWSSRFAQRVFHPFFNKRAPTAIDIEGYGHEKLVGHWLELWGTHSPERIAHFQNEFTLLHDLKDLPSREARFISLMNEMLTESLDNLGINEMGIKELMAKVMPRFTANYRVTERIYGITRGTLGGSELFHEPAFSSQLINALSLPDPVSIQHAIVRSYGSVPEIAEAAGKMGLPTDLMELTQEEWHELASAVKNSKRLRAFATRHSEAMAESIIGAWKSSVLLRPAWPLRVVGIDENLRALVHLHSMWDRLTGIKAVGMFLEGDASQIVGKGLTKKLERGVVNLSGKTRKALHIRERYLYIRMKDGTLRAIPAHLPGGLPDEAAVSAGVERNHLYTTSASSSRRLSKRMGILSTEIGPKHPMWTKSVEDQMNHVLYNDPLAQRIIKAKLGQLDENGEFWTRDKVIEWARGDKRQRMLLDRRRLEGSITRGESIEELVRKQEAIISYLTKDEPDILEKILLGNAKASDLLDNIPANQLPHAFVTDASESLAWQAAPIRRTIGHGFAWMMQKPTDFLSRQPLFKVIYQRERERLMNLAEARGHVFTEAEAAALEEGTHPIALGAKRFAVNDVNNVMFSYMERSQFAEASRLIMPFFGPFEEEFTVWAKLLWENPQAIGRASSLWRAAEKAGFVHKDEDTGEWVIPLTHLTAASGMLGLLTGLGGTSWMVPVQSLNMFFGSTLKVDIPGIGDVPLPMPGFSPPFQMFFEQAVDHMPETWAGKERLMAYAFQYGRGNSWIPRTWQRIFTWAGLPGGDPDLLLQAEQDVQDMLALQGADLSALDEGEIERMAKNLLLTRGLQGMVFPAAPLVEMPADEVRDQYFDWVDAYDVPQARDLLKQTYPERPDILMLAVSHSVSTRLGPALPPTQLVTAIMNNPEFREAALSYPEFAYWLLTSEVRDAQGDFDNVAYGQEIADSLREMRPIGWSSATIRDEDGRPLGQLNGRMWELDRIQGWDLYFGAEAKFEAFITANGISETRTPTAWKSAHDKFNAEVDEIRESHVAFAEDKDSVTVAQDVFFASGIQRLRQVIQEPLFASTPFGKAMIEYFGERDRVYAKMVKAGIGSIDDGSAELLGLQQDWGTIGSGVEGEPGYEAPSGFLGALVNRYGEDFTRPYDIWLRQDLHFVVDNAEQKSIDLPKKYLVEIQAPWERKWYATRKLFTSGRTSAEDAKAYDARRRLSIEAQHIEDRYGINPEQVAWQNLSPSQRKHEKWKIALLPYTYWSPFERKKMGVETSQDVEDAWADISERRTAELLEEERDPEGHDWDSYNQFLDEIVQRPGMAKEFSRNQTWGFGLWQQMPDSWKKGIEGDAWRNIRDFTIAARKAFKAEDFVDDGEFARARTAFLGYIDEWKDYSPDFARRWDMLSNYTQSNLIDVLMPELWFLRA